MPGPVEPEAKSHDQEQDDEIAALRSQMAEMQKKLDKLAKD